MIQPCVYLCPFVKTSVSGKERALGIFTRHLSLGEGILSIETTKTGKPLLRGCKDVHIGISHSRGILAAYIGPKEGGVDIEYTRPTRDFDGIANYIFRNEDKRLLREAINPQDRAIVFYSAWTRIEGIAKLHGYGISGLAKATKDHNTPYRHWLLMNTYLLCLCGEVVTLEDIPVVAIDFPPDQPLSITRLTHP
jgi:phosphopantetheinyl transferase